jgi:hypothetical protein
MVTERMSAAVCRLLCVGKVGFGMASRPSFQDTVNNIPFERLEVLGMTLESFPDCHNNFMGHFPITNTPISWDAGRG